MSTIQRTLLIAVIAIAFVFRFWGLDHDLHEGLIYHPDTPKQVRAAERFLQGQYYYHIGIEDYDGYPYFNPHLVECVARVGQPVQAGICRLAGLPYVPHNWNFYALFWITRILNSLFATWLVLVVYKIGKENFSVGAAWVAALFVALSPVDMTSSHFATCDTTAAFFATLAVLYAFRIYRSGRYLDCLLAAFFSACAFSSKYHAGMAIVPVMLALALRAGNWRSLFGGSSLRRVVVTLAVAACSICLTTPTLITHFRAMSSEIVKFLFHVSKYRGVPVEVKTGGLLTKFAFSMDRNLPVLLDILGPIICLAAILALFDLARRDHRKMILFSLPLVYFFVGVTLRPLAHPVYHTLMTPLVFLMAATMLTRSFPAVWQRGRGWLNLARVVIIALAAGYLLRYSVEQCFYFWHQDTTRMAGAWTEENVPKSFAVHAGDYAFGTEGFAPIEEAAGAVLASSSLDPLDIPGVEAWKYFSLQPLSLGVFMNPSIQLSRWTGPWLGRQYEMPVFQRWPSQTGNQFIFNSGPEFIRSEKLMPVRPEAPLTRWLVSGRRLDEVWICLRNGGQPNSIDLSFAGTTRKVWLEVGEVAWFPVTHLCRAFPSERQHSLYRLHVSAANGPALVFLATRYEEIGTALYNAGRYREAYPLLMRSVLESRNPTIAAEAAISGRLAGMPMERMLEPRLNALAARVLDVTDAGSLRSVYGISLDYLNGLEYISIPADRIENDGFAVVPDPAGPGDTALRGEPGELPHDRWFGASGLILDPGWYSLTVRARASTPGTTEVPLKIRVTDSLGVVRSPATTNVATLESNYYKDERFSFYVPAGIPEAKVLVEVATNSPIMVNRFFISPDPVGTVMALGRVFRAAVSNDVEAAAKEPLACDALVRLGDMERNEERWEQAFLDYAAAAQASPGIATPVRRMIGIRDHVPADALRPFADRIERVAALDNAAFRAMDVGFRGGIHLTAMRLRERAAMRGGSLGLALYWRADDTRLSVGEWAVLVHFVDAAGRIAFQGDYPLPVALMLPYRGGEMEPFYTEIKIPDSVKPGVYHIRTGIYRPADGRPLKIEWGNIPCRKGKVLLPFDVTVGDGNVPAARNQ